ncbi:uncharacterized protein LOC132450224 isoform X2 [Gadus macrocephalus]|uniref:uncharacterized protein LOC132450224 isoform X2 n=1 Tax=Gadus macrocephalus TaxID=80720 RepID=UPI0028CB8881|nr:uncharacterized protein LOC132450224 isoform X2 [Gadus macrocephalus]
MFGVSLCSIGLLLIALIHTAVTKDHLVMGGVGHTVILPCVSPLEGSCSDIRWVHKTKSGATRVASIPRREDANTGRFNIVSNCSLHINNITEVDVGRYRCSKDFGDSQYLSLITVSSQLRSRMFPRANITLSCNLVTFEGSGWCYSPLYQGMSLKWQDDNRPDYILAEQRISRCAVRLNVILQRGSRFSCLALVNRQVQNRVEFPVRIRVEGRGLPMPNSENDDQGHDGGSNVADGDGGNKEVIISVAVVGCAMTLVLALILMKKKKKRKPNDQLVARTETPLNDNTVINTDVAATAEDVTHADITFAGVADRKWETESEATNV